MKWILVSAFVCACVSAPGLLAAAAPSDPLAALRDIAKKTRAFKSLDVRFRQHKEMAAFGDAVDATGHLSIERPRRLAMDLEGPGGSTLIIDGDHMAMRYKALKKTERFDLARDPRARAIADHLFLLLDADPDALSGTYEITPTSSSPVSVRLVPKPEGLRKIIASVDIVFDAAGFVEQLSLHDASGDLTRWTFDDPRVDSAIDPATFAMP